MNEPPGTATTISSTPASLVAAGRTLFARYGYEGTSIRALTRQAGTNLGAVTYHFGSKKALYHAVIASFAAPLRNRITHSAAGAGTPIERLDAVIRAYFAHLAENPELPRLMLQQLASGREPPPPVVEMGGDVFRTLANLIRTGQAEGVIRPGPEALLAASVVSQPIFFNLLQPVLREVAAIDLADTDTRAHVVEHAVRFVRAALRPIKEHP